MESGYADGAPREDAAPRVLKLRDGVPRLVWTASADGRLLYSNPDLRCLLDDCDCEGCAIEELMPGRVLHADDGARWLGVWRGAVASGESWEVEYRVRSDVDGATHWYLERGAQCECRGRQDHWFVTATRIDAQKQRESELLRSLELKDRFFATLLHELRNPLAPMANAMEALAARPGDSRIVSGACGVIRRQLRQLTLLVDDLLDVSRIARGVVALHREWSDLAEVIAASVETARPVIQSRSHEVRMVEGPAPVLVFADPIRLRQVVTNLLINAAKYTNPGGHIRITLEHTHREALIRVRDDGIGIASEILSSIFDPFTQAAPRSRAAMGGMGVGLAVARELVHLHGGLISAHSEGAGRGSEFVIRLPLQTSGILDAFNESER